MNIRLEHLFKNIEDEKENLLTKISVLAESRLVYFSKPGTWSILQILAHLLTIERLSLHYMKKKSLGINQLKDSGFPEFLKIYCLKMVQYLPIKIKAPKIILDNTPQNISLSEIIIQWGAIRVDIKNFLDGVEEKHLYKKIYKHAFVGQLDVIQALIFFKAHIRHHLPQIIRLLSKSE